MAPTQFIRDVLIYTLHFWQTALEIFNYWYATYGKFKEKKLNITLPISKNGKLYDKKIRGFKTVW